MLQDAFRPLDDFADFKLAFGLAGFFDEAHVLFGQHRFGHGDSHLLADKGQEGDFFGSVIVTLAMVNVHYADHFAATDQRHGCEGVISIFNQCLEILEANIGRGIRSERDNGFVLRNPSGDALAHLHTQVAKVFRVRDLRGAQDDFLGFRLDQIDQAGVAFCNLDGQSDNLTEHLIKGQLRTDDIANSM